MAFPPKQKLQLRGAAVNRENAEDKPGVFDIIEKFSGDSDAKRKKAADELDNMLEKIPTKRAKKTLKDLDDVLSSDESDDGRPRKKQQKRNRKSKDLYSDVEMDTEGEEESTERKHAKPIESTEKPSEKNRMKEMVRDIKISKSGSKKPSSKIEIIRASEEGSAKMQHFKSELEKKYSSYISQHKEKNLKQLIEKQKAKKLKEERKKSLVPKPALAGPRALAGVKSATVKKDQRKITIVEGGPKRPTPAKPKLHPEIVQPKSTVSVVAKKDAPAPKVALTEKAAPGTQAAPRKEGVPSKASMEKEGTVASNKQETKKVAVKKTSKDATKIAPGEKVGKSDAIVPGSGALPAEVPHTESEGPMPKNRPPTPVPEKCPPSPPPATIPLPKAGSSEAKADTTKVAGVPGKGAVSVKKPDASKPEGHITDSDDEFRPPVRSKWDDDDQEGDDDLFKPKKTLSAPQLADLKKPVIGLKISDSSSQFITEGKTVNQLFREQNLEEGEVSESDNNNKSPNLSSSTDTDDYLEPAKISDESSGEIKDDDSPKKKKKKKKKSKKHKKDKKKHKKKKHHKKKHSSRSRSRNFSGERKRKRSGSFTSHSRTRSRSGSLTPSPSVRRSRSPSPRRKHERRRSASRSPRRRRSYSPRERDSRSYSYRDDRSRGRGRGNWVPRRSPERDGYRYDRFWAKYSRKSQERDRRASQERDRVRQGLRDADRRSDRLGLDKTKLRQAALKNAYRRGDLKSLSQDDLIALRSGGGKSREELTRFCEKLMEYNEDGTQRKRHPSDSEDDESVIHPYQVSSSQAPIRMNIRNANHIDILNAEQKASRSTKLRLEFPVSSGSQHRTKEDQDWVPVMKAETQKSSTEAMLKPVSDADKIFDDSQIDPKVDIGKVVSTRLSAVRKLQENPKDIEAIARMKEAEDQMSRWASSKNLPGAFTGSTGVQVLTQRELGGKFQAWVKKDALTRAKAVQGGVGNLLLQKMGWRPGEGLGRHSEGHLEPLAMEFKVDRKGLQTTEEELPAKRKTPLLRTRPTDLSGKHPVSAVLELCQKQHWPAPRFEMVSSGGPIHHKSYLFKVVVNGVTYQPSVGSTSKKTGKAECATACLQALGLIPRL